MEPIRGRRKSAGVLRRKLFAASALILSLFAVLALSACGSSSSSGGSTTAGSSTGGSTSGSSENGGEIVVFGATKSEGYINVEHKALQDEAENLGYTVKFIENNFSASEQTQQIQQYLASGQHPKAFVIWATDPKADVALAAQLDQIAPVFAENQTVAEGGFKYIKAYTGAEDVLIGEVAGENMGNIKKELEAKGTQFNTPGGGVLFVNAPAGLAISSDRAEGMETTLSKAGMQVLENNEGCASAEECYEVANQLIPKWKSKLDFIYTTSNQFAPGVVKAAEQSGLKPGKDVQIITGNCSGPASVMEDGSVAATGGQYATMEGQGVAQMVARYFNSGEKVEEGEEFLKPQTGAPTPDLSSPPAQRTYLPNPAMVGAKSLEGEVWGIPIKEACAAE
jgi:ABC-type sugar transport system substrate-binding protein